jgi:methyl-accepting chemotaxis protein
VKLKISHKMMLLAVGTALMTGAVGALVSALRSSNALVASAEQNLVALTGSRKDSLSRYLDSIKEDIGILSTNQTVHEAFSALSAAYAEIPTDPVASLHKLYIKDNPNPTGQKEKLDAAPDGSTYSKVHAQYHPWIRSFLQARSYYDIFLINKKGDVVYTVFKEPDFATNVVNGPWKDSGLGKVFSDAFKSGGGETYYQDFAEYAPSNNVPAAFVGKAIKDSKGNPIAVVVFQMPIERINNIMKNTIGMGESGETYIVGTNKLMLSDSRFSKESTLLKQKVDTPTVAGALNGKEGVSLIKDYHGANVYSAFSPLEYLGSKFAIIGEMGESEVLKPVHALYRDMLIASLIIILVVSAIGFFLSRKITMPLNNLLEKMGLLEKGDKSFEVTYQNRVDEIGDIARALESFKQSAIEQDKMMEESKFEQLRKTNRQEKIDSLIKKFDEVSSQAVTTVATAATELYQTAEAMNKTAETAGQQSLQVAEASKETFLNVQSVAVAVDEMTAAVKEITIQISKSIQAVNETVEKVETANQSSLALARASESIGDMTLTIENISGQINLLALNATIESARAGEAGKGFAVVASEVKTLANQTGKATEQIQSQIGSVQSVSSSVVDSLNTIRKAIGKVDEYSSAISAAVEEQSAVNQEITRNMSTASSGVEQITQGIGAVSQSIQTTSHSTYQVLDAAKMLSQQSEHLRKEVQTFLKEIRTV